MAFAPAVALLGALRAREVSARELLDLYLARIGSLEPGIGAVVTLDAERAMAAAAAADDARAAGDDRPLLGLPVTVKDSLETAGLRTTAGARELSGYVPGGDAAAVARLRAAGAVVVGKTNLPAWASDVQSSNEVFGTTFDNLDDLKAFNLQLVSDVFDKNQNGYVCAFELRGTRAYLDPLIRLSQFGVGDDHIR